MNVLERVELKISSIEVLLYQAYHVYKLAIRTKMSVIRKKTAVSSKDTYTIRAMVPYRTPDKVTLTGINIKKCGFNRICQEKMPKIPKICLIHSSFHNSERSIHFLVAWVPLPGQKISDSKIRNSIQIPSLS